MRDLSGTAAPTAEALMLDIIFIAVGTGAFALAVFYTAACDRL